MMPSGWVNIHELYIIHYPSYMKNVVGTQRAAFLRPHNSNLCREHFALSDSIRRLSCFVSACQGTKGDKKNSRNHFVVITGAKVWGIFQVHLIRILYAYLIRIWSKGLPVGSGTPMSYPAQGLLPSRCAGSRDLRAITHRRVSIWPVYRAGRPHTR